jgi:FkbM family methyltransferase
MAGRDWLLRVEGGRIRLAGEHFGLAREIYGRRVYTSMPGFGIRPGDVVVDLGANVGAFSVFAARLGASVLAVEAQSRFTEEIRHNASTNDCADAVTVDFGLVGATSGVFSDSAAVRAASHFGLPPPTLGLAELLDRHGIERISFLKVDIEGSEFSLFEKPEAWIYRVDRIAMEVHPPYGSVDRLVQTLHSAGFTVWIKSNELLDIEVIHDPTGYVFASRRAA